jgi:hypothetical protein
MSQNVDPRQSPSQEGDDIPRLSADPDPDPDKDPAPDAPTGLGTPEEDPDPPVEG